MRMVLTAVFVALVLSACASREHVGSGAPADFRVRAGLGAPLSEDTGWAGGPGEPATVTADQPFRLRLPAAGTGETESLSLEYRRNSGAWTPVEAHDFPLPEREVEQVFADFGAGALPPGWSAAGADVRLVETAGGRVLRLEAGGQAGAARFEPPWPLEAFAVEAELKASGPSGFFFGGAGAVHRVEIDPAAAVIRLTRTEDGGTQVLAEAGAAGAGDWLSVEVQAEDGLLEIEARGGEIVLSLPVPAGFAAEPLGVFADAGAALELRRFAVSGEPATPRASIVAAEAYAHGALTPPLLDSESEAGFAVSLREGAPAWRAAPGAVAGFEWPLVIRRFADGAETNEAGDVFEFRMVDGGGAPVSLGPVPALTLAVPDGHLGGTYVETPGRIGPFQTSNGDLYVLMEPAESDNLFMVVKSEDAGRSWVEIDGANRPATGDLEAVDARLVDGTLYILHQVTEAVLLHAFNTSDHAGATDGWAFTDAPVAETEALSQMATLAPLGGDRFVAVFLGDTLYYAVGEPGGAWSEPALLDRDADTVTVGPQAIAAPDGGAYIAYADTRGALWLRVMDAEGALGSRRLIAQGAITGEGDFGAVLPLSFLEGSGDTAIAYRLADGSLWERRLSAGGALSDPAQITAGPVVTNAVDSQQPAADIAADGGRLHALFVEERSGAIFSAHGCGGVWSEPVLRVDDIEGSWVRGSIFTRSDGARVYGFVYDAGSKGGAGMNRYAEIELDALPACR